MLMFEKMVLHITSVKEMVIAHGVSIEEIWYSRTV